MAEDDVRTRFQNAVERLERDIRKQRTEIEDRKAREAEHNLQAGDWGNIVRDPMLPIMLRRLAQSEKDHAELVSRLVIPEGMGEPDLEPQIASYTPEQQATFRIFEELAKAGALPVADPVLDEDEVTAVYEAQLGPKPVKQPGTRPR